MKPIFRSLSSKVTPVSVIANTSNTTFPSAVYGITLDQQHNHFGHFPSSMNNASFRRQNSQNLHHHHHHPPQHHVWRRRNCLWPYWSTVNRAGSGRYGSGRGIGNGGKADCTTFIPSSPIRCTNKLGFVTIPGVENIDPFLLSLRFYGFDLWMNRYAETGKRFSKRNFITKGLFYFALLMINLQMLVSVLTSASVFVDGKKNFYSSLDDVRTFILKFTMTFAVDLWYLRSRSQSGMTHLIAINYLRANSPRLLRSTSIRWTLVMIVCTTLHWSVSQYWLSSMSVDEHRKWLNVIQCAVNMKWFQVEQQEQQGGEGGALAMAMANSSSNSGGADDVLRQGGHSHHNSFFSVAVLRAIATMDSFVYRMYIYGSRFGSMCAYCLLSKLLTECIIGVNRVLTDHLDNEYHYHHHYCRRSANKCDGGGGGGGGGGGSNNCAVTFNLELFKEQFNIVYRMHQEIEQCFGPLNFIWFGSLFVVSCIDIFFLAWKAGTEWFRVWSLLEFCSMIVLWVPHFFVAYHASRVSIESWRMKLHLKELCRQDEEVRDILVSSTFYPKMKPTLAGVVQLDIGFLLSFVVTLATFSVMLIQLNPDAAAKIG